jgi:haloalkane dehalogenase
MHYVDEGDAPHAIVMLHGNPAWSFTYRTLIRCLSEHYRCIAPDLVGFGLSDKPRDWDYLPEHHAETLEQLISRLDLQSLTLMVADWGGPIGISYAVDHPERVKSLVITNSWMWSLRGSPRYELFSRLMGSAFGRWLIRRFNLFVTVLMPLMFGARLSRPVARQYIGPLGAPSDRKGCWVFPKQIIGSSDWLQSLWARRAAIADKPALILWGRRDIAFRPTELRRWRALFPQAPVHEYREAGHFLAEELGPALCPILKRHLDSISSPAP